MTWFCPLYLLLVHSLRRILRGETISQWHISHKCVSQGEPMSCPPPCSPDTPLDFYVWDYVLCSAVNLREHNPRCCNERQSWYVENSVERNCFQVGCKSHDPWKSHWTDVKNLNVGLLFCTKSLFSTCDEQKVMSSLNQLLFIDTL